MPKVKHLVRGGTIGWTHLACGIKYQNNYETFEDKPYDTVCTPSKTTCKRCLATDYWATMHAAELRRKG